MRLLKLLPLVLGLTTLSACADTVTTYSYYRPYGRVYYVPPYQVERYSPGYYDEWGYYHPGTTYYYSYDSGTRIYYGPEHWRHDWHRDDWHDGGHHYHPGNSYSPSKDPGHGSSTTPFGAENPYAK